MKFTTRTSPYVTGQQDVGSIMRQVLYAMLPGILILIWYFGWGTLSNLLLATGFALLFEWGMLKLRNRPVSPFLNDYSAVLTAWLLAVAMPAFSPWWLIGIAVLFAIVIAKHLYGGLGYNPFNPAMVGYAAMLVSYPVQMTIWPVPVDFSFNHIGFGQMLQQVFAGGAQGWDAFTAATPLDAVKVNLRMDKPLSDIYANGHFGLLAGQAWEWVSLAWLAGGLWLLLRKVITWQIPAALLGSLALMSGIFWLIDPQAYASPLFHLFSGAAMLGAFFIATDPVSSSTTPLGKVFYAGGIGAFTWVIRTWGGYPDAIAFSVLIMNMAVPLIDYYTQPRVYGTKRGFPG
ncbi:MAG: electron transport complex subunit RsxD [Gammaproteobacteria bacterium]|nr:electron transport complex subunit RsxD [Gammaproteobacteria bacterium]MBU1722641.1 electron transport complex subunit RsxD [Gammaproteobacteria bacterium]MBU2006688.1 electron transport complex subunit RsxD [Gammaproteobacteria bacterium]